MRDLDYRARLPLHLELELSKLRPLYAVTRSVIHSLVLRWPGYRLWIYRFRDPTPKHRRGEWKAMRLDRPK